jgi:AcrR family transcriptional regulator
MPRRSGRPAKGENLKDSRQVIIDTAIALIKKKGADSITVRNVCGEADLSIGTFYHYFRDKDDLMMYFLRETSFDGFPLETALSEPGNRISELYMHLIRRYMELGLDFMKSFYSTSNRSLSAYMGEQDGSFAPDTVMARSERELLAAQEAGYIIASVDIHTLCKDICTIVKGCVFEWCLNDGTPDIEKILYRIINHYLALYTAVPGDAES